MPSTTRAPSRPSSGCARGSPSSTRRSCIWAACSGCCSASRTAERSACSRRFRVMDWVDAVRRHRPTTVSLVPTALRMILDADLDPAGSCERPVGHLRHRAALAGGRRRVLHQVRRAGAVTYAATEFGGGVAGLEPHGPPAVTGPPSAGVSGVRMRAASFAWSTRDRRDRYRRTWPGPARSERLASSVTTWPGIGRPTWRVSTGTASCGSSAAPTRPSSAGASRCCPMTSGWRSSATPACTARRSSGWTTPASGPCRSPLSSCGGVRWRSPPSSCWPMRRRCLPVMSCRPRCDRGGASAHALRQGRPPGRARAAHPERRVRADERTVDVRASRCRRRRPWRR